MMRLVCVTLAFTAAVGIRAAGTQTASDVSSKTYVTTGVVKSVSASALTLESGDERITFAIRGSTRFVGSGRASDLVLRERRRATDFVKAGDRVAVTFRRSGSAMTAVQVRVVQRSLK